MKAYKLNEWKGGVVGWQAQLDYERKRNSRNDRMREATTKPKKKKQQRIAGNVKNEAKKK